LEINPDMKRTLILTLLFFLTLTCTSLVQAQNKVVDSLLLQLSKVENDSLKIRTLLKIVSVLTNPDNKLAAKYNDQALELAMKNNFRWAQSLGYSNKSFLAGTRGDHREALEYNNKSLNISLSSNDSVAISTDYNNIGEAYMELGKLEEAHFYLSKSLEMARLNARVKDKAKKDNAILTMAIAAHNLGVLYSKFNRMDIALTYFKDSEDYSKTSSDAEGPAYNNHEIGNAYLRTKDFKKAEDNLMLALKESRRLNISFLTPRILQSIGELEYARKDYTRAVAYLDSAITFFNEVENTFGKAEANLFKSKVFLDQKKFKDAIDLASASLKVADDLKAQILMYDCYQVLSRCAEMQGDYRTALKYNQQAQQTQDSLTSINVMSQVFENEFQMRSQKKDDEIASLTKRSEQSATEVKRQEFLRNIFAVVFALTIVLLYSVYRSGRRKVEMNDLLMQHQAEIEKRTQELEELNKVKDKFFSIISHDLRSPINSLAGLLDLMEKNEIRAEELPALTREMRVQFSHTKNLINNLLDWTLLQMNKVSIKKEKVVLKPLINDNIRLLSSMSTKKTNFINEVDDSMVAFADQNMINLVFRNLVLNGIKFTDNGGTIKISAVKEGDDIKVSIADNGVGIAPDVQSVLFDKTTGYSTRGTANEKGTGLGLILCKEFIERNGGRIWLESQVGKGSTFFVTIPVS
jgi:signal transduction histidine kinase